MTETEVVDALTLWRYWHLPTRRGQPRDLRNVQAKDKTVWGPGVTHAVCRRDPTHTPPHPGCSCGIYAMSAADIQMASAVHYYARDEYTRLANLGTHGTFGIPERPGYIDARVPWLLEQADYYVRYDVIIGRVQLCDAVQYTPDDPAQLRCWRGRSALLEALYLSPRITRDPEQLIAKFSQKYGVPCEIGYPPYSQQDWDDRSPADTTDELGPDSEKAWATVGLYPPGKTAPPSKFFTTTLPPDRGRKRLRTWIET